MRKSFDDDTSPDYGHDVIALLREKAPRLAMMLAVSQAAYPGVKYARRVIRSRRLYTIKVQGIAGYADGLYSDLHEWVLSQLPEKDRKAVIAHAKPAAYQDWERGSLTQDSQLHLRYDGDRAQAITVSGYKAKVSASDGSIGSDGKKAGFPEIT